MKNNPKIGLALGGGGARGAAHIGVLEELEREQIPIDLIVGTSVGSIIGAFYAYGFPLDKLREIFAKSRLGSLPSFRFLHKGVFSAKFIEKSCGKYIGNVQFRELSIPMAAVAADLKSGESVILQKGTVKKAASASSAFLPHFTPVEIDGRLLIDGGVLSNVPVDATRKLGAEVVIAVDLGSILITEAELNVMSILFRSIDIIIRKITDEELTRADVVIKPDIDQFPFDFKLCDEFFHRGREAARKAMPAIKGILEKNGDNRVKSNMGR